jgi:hypothetical protein
VKKWLIAASSAAALVLVPCTAALAESSSNTVDRSSFPAAGAVFQCAAPLGDLTAQSGWVTQVIHTSVDGTGVFHITGTLVPHQVTLSDTSGTTYQLSGAEWFGGKVGSDQQPIVLTDTEHFVVRSADGGAVARVSMVGHLSPNGVSFEKNLGTCLPPQG